MSMSMHYLLFTNTHTSTTILLRSWTYWIHVYFGRLLPGFPVCQLRYIHSVHSSMATYWQFGILMALQSTLLHTNNTIRVMVTNNTGQTNLLSGWLRPSTTRYLQLLCIAVLSSVPVFTHLTLMWFMVNLPGQHQTAVNWALTSHLVPTRRMVLLNSVLWLPTCQPPRSTITMQQTGSAIPLG